MVRGDYTFQSILYDIVSANPTVARNDIVDYFLLTISEIIPDVIKKVKLPCSPLTVFEIRRREFLDQRRRKTGKRRLDQDSESDSEAVLRTAKASFEFRDSDLKRNVFTSNVNMIPKYAPNGGFEYTGAGQPGIYTVFSPAGKVALNYDNTIDKMKTVVFIQSSHQNEQQKHAYTSPELVPYDIEPELAERRDISMSQGRFFSIIEKVSKDFALNNPTKNLTFLLSSSNVLKTEIPDKSSHHESFILTLRIGSPVSIKESKDMARELQDSILRRLNERVIMLKDTEKFEFNELIQKFYVEPETQSEVTKSKIRHLKNLPPFRKVREKQVLQFEDLKEIRGLMKGSNSIVLLREILNLLNGDATIRSEKFETDCFKELYRGEERLPQDIGMVKSNSLNILICINEALRAIVLNEYTRLYNEERLNFINRKITYDEYLDRTEKHTIDATKSWP